MKRLVSGTQMNKIDHLAITRYHIPSLFLMENAGEAIYQEIIKIIEPKTKIIVVCGVGNNGGDGFVLARLLRQSYYNAHICLVGNPDKMSKDCRYNYELCVDLKVPFLKQLETCDVLVDAIFGTGLTRTITGAYKDVIEMINAMEINVISIDIPSGIDSDNGNSWGCAIKADKTYTLQAGKIGLYLSQGRICSGKVEVLDIKIPRELIEQSESNVFLLEKEQMKEFLPNRSVISNKGTYGKVLCIGGSEGMSGAISMAALAALRSGCGLLTCAIPDVIQEIVARNIWESMNIILPSKDGHIAAHAKDVLSPKINTFTCILIGCGITRSDDIKEIMKLLLNSEVPLLVDADGLYALKPLLHKYSLRKELIITPHLKEFAFLIDEELSDVIENPLHYAEKFSLKYPFITLVLKSDTTLIVKDGRVCMNTYGNNGLAKGGSGDVLAGIITGLYAQNKDAWKASVLGVFLHAYSADLLLENYTHYSMLPTDVLKQIDYTIKELEGMK